MPRSGSVLSGQTTWTNRSASSEIAAEASNQTMLIVNHGTRLFAMFAISAAICIICGIVRSAVVLGDSIDKYFVLEQAEEKLNLFHAMEALTDAVYMESFARMKYISTNLNPIYYSEMTTAVNDIDLVFEAGAASFAKIYFQVPEYREYNCSFYRIRSNLGTRTSAIPVNQHRSLDERHLDPWQDVDFYECLMMQLADIQTQTMTSSLGFDYLWQCVYSYIASVRSLLSFKVAMNYAYLTRELVLKQGSVSFKRHKDSQTMDDSLATAQALVRKAYQIAFYGIGPSSLPAIQIMDHLMDQLSTITNATQVYLLVQAGDKFEPTTAAKTVIADLTAAREEFKEDMFKRHSVAAVNGNSAIISEAIKLFFFAIFLPALTIRCVVHFKNEAKRLQSRYETSIERYVDSCKAIFRLLPEPVAKKLNLGKQVRPEFYHNVTVFYSDIVGFTTICSKLSAIQVLQMLNTIYTTFDNRMKIYNCYKIETIGDAYVVASGVPIRTTTHAAEVASLALHLVEEVGLIKVPNSTKRITVRIGLNSGPVIAGIVGVKMLRYCLFGKTVLYAARMEQTSQAQRIQVSQTTYQELENQGGFIMTARPKNEWPNNEQPTYWLNGKATMATTLSLFSTVDKSTALNHVDISTAY